METTASTSSTASPIKMERAAFIPEKIPNGFSSSITKVLGQEVHALTSADASLRPLVMVHGALASRRYLLPTAELLASSFRVYVPEMPGHGASSRPERALTVEEQADVIAEWMKLHSFEKTFLFANSYGSQVCASLTAKYPELVDRLMLTGPTCDPNAPSLTEQAFRLWLDGFGEPKGAQQQLFDDLHDMSMKLAFETAHQMVSNDIRPNLEKISCRTLVLRGSKDTIAPQAWTEEVAGKLVNACISVIEQAPHCVNYAAPMELTKIIQEFLL